MADGLIDLLHTRSEMHPTKRAFCSIRDDVDGEVVLTYSQLADRAKSIGAALQARLPVGSRALLVFPAGLEFIEAFFGCLFAGVTAVPVSPPRRNRSTRFLQAITQDCSPDMVLCTAAQRESWQAEFQRFRGLGDVPWVASDSIACQAKHSWAQPQVDGDSLALLQYTSGSTSEPRGVMVSHNNLLNNSKLIHQAFENTTDSHGVFWLPLYHDMGLIGGVIQTIYCGGSSTLLAPAAFLQQPLLWLRMISQQRATISGGPDFAYELCACKATPEKCSGLDLSSWQLAFTGAETVRAETLDRFVETFAPYGFRREAFYPCYGLAEATLIAAGGRRDQPPVVLHVDPDSLAQNRVVKVTAESAHRRALVGCGQSLPGQRIEIVEPGRQTTCEAGRVGEILIAGPSVTGGYYNRPEESDSLFRKPLAGMEEVPFLRTGDLGFMQGNELFITGRIKDLIVIRGQNFYPEDIERTGQAAHASFRARHGAAFSIDVAGQERLVVVQEIEPRCRDVDADSAITAIREEVAREHGVGVFSIVLAKPGAIPRTSSNKIQRFACRENYLDGSLATIAQWTTNLNSEPARQIESPLRHPQSPRSAAQIESWLANRIASRLRMDPVRVGVTMPFIEFGMSSLDAVEITAELESWVGRGLSPTAIYNYPTISALSKWLAREPTELGSAVDLPGDASSESDPLLQEVLSLSQEEMEAFILQQMAKQDE